jgi:PAS domain S-box-containing protein
MKTLEKFVADHLDLFLDCIDDIITIVDKNGILEKSNKAWFNVTGIDREPYIGKNMRELVKLDILRNSAALTAIAMKKPVSMNIEYFNGTTATWTYVPVFDDKGELERVIGTGRDVTKLVMLESKLRQAQFIIDQYDQKIRESEEYFGTGHIIYESDEMQRIIRTAIKAAKTDSSILILGETGVGKELIAELIHRSSQRKGSPFVIIDSAAIPEALMESELFGYDEGAFTGAKKTGKQGFLEKAKGGTVFLDEIGELPLNMQSKLLRVTQEGKFTRVGGRHLREADLRIIAATNISKDQMMDRHKFRQDLFYRLGAVIIHVPPLRERRDDIFPLIRHFIKQLNLKYETNVHIPSRLMTRLHEYDWPGNVRELKNVINGLIVLADGNEVQEEELNAALQLHRKELLGQYKKKTKSRHPTEFMLPEQSSFKKPVQQIEETLFREAYRERGSMVKVAAVLGVHPSTLYRKIKKGLISLE